MSDIQTFFNTHKPKSTPGIFDVAIRCTPRANGELALDFCCGAGKLTSMVAKQGYRSYGIDISSHYIGRQGDDAAGYIVADVGLPLPFRSGSASAIYCIDSLHYFADPEYVLGEFARLLRPGGVLIFSTQNNYNLAGVKRFLIKKLTGKTWSPWLVHPVESSIVYPWLIQALKRQGFKVEYERGMQFLTPWISLLPNRIRTWSPWKSKPYRSIDGLGQRVKLPERIEASFAGRFSMIMFICAKKMQMETSRMQHSTATQPPDTASSPRRVNLFDVLVILAFLCFGVFAEVGILQAGHYPYIAISGDGANITSYAAAWDHPELFKADEILGNLNNIRFYATIHIPITRFLASIVGSYSVAFVLPLGIHAFVQLLGFYILGLVLFRNRYWALLLSLITMLWVPMNLGEFWGFYTEPLPRFTFEALLPFVLAACIAWKDKPRRWVWIMVAAGLLIYVHPVSAPVWGAAIWLGLWVCRPVGWTFKRQAGYMVLLGIVFVLISLPFAINFTGAREGSVVTDYQSVFNIMLSTLPPGTMNLPQAIRDFGISMTQQVLPVLGIVGAIIVFRLRKNDRQNLYIVLWWIVGIAIVAVAIPLVDHTVSRLLSRTPFEIDLIRGVRYLIPLSLMFCLWALYELAKVATRQRLKQAFQIGGVVLLAYWGVTHYQQIYVIRNGINCLRQFKLICSSPTLDSELMDAVKTQTEPGAPILLSSGDYQWLSIRYYALRPLIYIWRDGGGLLYANEDQSTTWVKLRDAIDVINAEQDLTTRLNDLVNFGRAHNAQYLVTDFQVDTYMTGVPKASLLYSNAHGSLVAIH